MGRRKKNDNLLTNESLKKMYGSAFNAAMEKVMIYLFSNIGELENVLIVNKDKDIFNSSDYDFTYYELEREIIKQLIKNNLFISEVTIKNNTLVLNTTNDNIFTLLYNSDEIEDIKQEISGSINIENERTLITQIEEHNNIKEEIEVVIKNYLENEFPGIDTTIELVDKVKLIWNINIIIFKVTISYVEIKKRQEVIDENGNITYKEIKAALEELLKSEIEKVLNRKNF